MPDKVAILGAGSWGIAQSLLLNSGGFRVALWEFDPAECTKLKNTRQHEGKLPSAVIPNSVLISNDLEETVSGAEYIVFVVPSQKVRAVCDQLKPIVHSGLKYINLAKGVEVDSLKRMSEVIAESLELPSNAKIATISGPSHAEEVARNIPTSVVAASKDIEFAEEIQRVFSNNYFRVYRSDDIIGVELGGALKNIIAIASGITQGLGFGDNTTGALLTRGLAEISRMAVKVGANPLTFAGLSGIGDLITTCVSKHSRNRYVGEKIGQGQKLPEVLAGMTMVAEGVDTCRSAYSMGQKYDVEMPITDEVYQVLFDNKSPESALEDLMGRSLKEEIWE